MQCSGPHMDDRTGVHDQCPIGEDVDRMVECPDCDGRGYEYVSMMAPDLSDCEVEKDVCPRCAGTKRVSVCDKCLSEQEEILFRASRSYRFHPSRVIR